MMQSFALLVSPGLVWREWALVSGRRESALRSGVIHQKLWHV